MKGLLASGALIIAIIVSGLLSWNWIKPESFGGAFIFLATWSILSTIFRYVLLIIFLAISEK